MSLELKAMLSKVAEDDNKREEIEFEEGIERYKFLLLRIAKEKKLDVATIIEGTDAVDLNKNVQDLNVLEKAHLVEGKTKYTHRNVYRQYELTLEGAELAEKLSREN